MLVVQILNTFCKFTEMSNDERTDLEMIMRQTSCYNVKFLKERYNKCNNDVLATIIDIMNIPEPDRKQDRLPETKFSQFRNIIAEKDKIYTKKMEENALKR